MDSERKDKLTKPGSLTCDSLSQFGSWAAAQKRKSTMFVWLLDLVLGARWELVCKTVDAQFLARSSNSFIQEK
jgi:hypothetical protein